MRHTSPALILPASLSAAAALAIVLACAPAAPAQAACFADYQARRGGPVELHYGTIQIPDDACSEGAAARVVAQRIRADGWELLSVLSVFGPDGLARRERDAGAYHLRY